MSDASDYGAPPAMSPTTHRKVESTDDALQSPQLFGPGLGHGRKPSNPPQRPARPPTPDLSMPESIPRTLAPEFVEAIKSPTASHGFSGARPPSMSFRGLRRQSMNKSRPRTRVNPHPREESSTSYSSYTSTSTRGESLGSTDDAAHVYHPFPHDEFGMDDDHVHPSAHSHGSASRKEHRLTSRLFSFGRKSRHEDERPPTIMHISGPIPTSFQHLSPTDLAASGLSTPTSATATPTSATVPPVPSIPSVRGLAPPAMLAPASLFTHSNNSGSTLGPNDVQGSNPNSPTSPHHVRRKPVPGMEGQRDSAYSVGSAKQA
jgi:hypothetical protein